MKEILALLETVLTTHQRKSEFLQNLDGLQFINGQADPAAKLREIGAFLQECVLEHFRLEEERLFPELLRLYRDGQTAQIIAELRAEHRQLRPKAESFLACIQTATSTSTGELLAALQPDFRGFFGALQRHAHREDAFLVPLLGALRQQTAPKS